MALLSTDKGKRLQRVYGPDFPKDVKNGEEWRQWVKKQMREQDSFRRDSQMHYSRYDNFRAGKQWISTRDGRTWKEPNADKAQLRPVLNLLGPALDFRLGILMEQRPGFKVEPLTSGTAGREIAEAQQAVVEYEFYQQRAWLTFLDAMFWAQTHGAAFVHVYVDKTGGPEHKDVELIAPTDDRYLDFKAAGYQVDEETGAVMLPLDESGNIAAPDTKVLMINEGILRSRVVLAAETLVDPEGRSVNGPIDPAKWFLTRRVRDVRVARLETGLEDLEPDTAIASADGDESAGELDQRWSRGIPSFPTARTKRTREAVYEYNIYIAKDKNGFPNGAWVRVVGDKVVLESDEEEGLPGGVIPFARFTDGSSDPQMYPKPVVSDWIGDQISINALLGSLLQHARTVGTGRVLAQKNTVLEETYSKIAGSVLEYTGQKPEIVGGSGAGRDNWQLLTFLISQFENKSGWNNMARGQVTGGSSGSGMQDVSGRALLGAKELFERTFGPSVRAAAEGASEWASVVIKYAQHIYDTPRMIPSVDRPDLARMIDKKMLGDRPVVFVDPETLMPLPRALRHQMLFDHLEKGIITQAEYRRRAPYADIRNLTMGETEQWQRAQWVNQLIEERYEELAAMDPVMLFSPDAGLPIFWQDNPGVHKQALNELILNDRKQWTVRKMAADRWGIYDQLERAQMQPPGGVDQATGAPLPGAPVPWEVVGVPSDRVQMPAPAAPAPGMPPAGPGVAPAGGGESAPMVGTSPAPEMSPMVTGASGQAAAPLGTYGSVEEQAMES
jgi:hypothetical protein